MNEWMNDWMQLIYIYWVHTLNKTIKTRLTPFCTIHVYSTIDSYEIAQLHFNTHVIDWLELLIHTCTIELYSYHGPIIARRSYK